MEDPPPRPSFEVSASLRAHLVRMAEYLGQGRFDPEDVVQDVITRAFVRFQSGAPPPRCGLEPFLFVAVKNEVTSRHRQARVRARVERGLASEEPAVEAPGDEPAPAIWLTLTDEELAEAMKVLSRKQREAFEAVSRGGERYAAIAVRLGIKEGALAKRLFDARSRLRKALRAILARRESPLVKHPPMKPVVD
jgi:RNA polymerase sigma factor (sigma-70 family)